MSDNTAILERKKLLQTQLRTCSAETNEIKTRYNVKSTAELETMIKNGAVEEHPAWEDLMLLENLEERTSNIQKELAMLEAPLKPIKQMRGFVKGGDAQNIREEEDRF